MSNSLGGDTFTRNMREGHTCAWTDEHQTDFGMKLINITFFFKEKSGCQNIFVCVKNSIDLSNLHLKALQ